MIEESIDRLAQAIRDLTTELAVARGAPGQTTTAAPAAAPAPAAGRRQAAKPADKVADNKSPVPAASGGSAAGSDAEALTAARKEIQGLMKDLARDQIDSILGKHLPDGRLSSASIDQCALIKADALAVIDGTGEQSDDPLAI